MTNPTDEKIAEWRKEFESKYPSYLLSRLSEDSPIYVNENVWETYKGYYRRCVEDASEIASLKAQLAGANAEIEALKQGLYRADEKLAQPKTVWELSHENGNYLFATKASAESFMGQSPGSVAGGMYINEIVLIE